MSALIVYLGGELSPALQEGIQYIMVKLSDILAQEKIDAQDAQDAKERIADLEALSATQLTQIATLTQNSQAAIDAGFDPLLLQQISDTATQIHTTLKGSPPPDTATVATTSTTATSLSAEQVDPAP